MPMFAPKASARTVVVAALAAALATSAVPAVAAPMSAAAAGGLAGQSSLPIVQVKNGRNAAIFGALAGVAALGVGAAIASRNSYDNGYGGGYGYSQPGYYAQPQPSYGYYGGPVAVEEPVYGYDEPAAVYAAPRYYEEPIVTYDNRPVRRHHAGGPAKRQMDNFRDSYR